MMFSFSTCRLVLLVSAACTAVTSAELTVNLGGAGDYAILAKSGISTVPSSKITGNIAVSPIAATAMTGFALILESGAQFATSAQVTGKAFGPDYAVPIPAALTTAVSDMEAAYTDAVSRHPTHTNVGGGILGGVTLTPGVYKFDTNVNLIADVHLSGAGVYIIQVAGNLVQAAYKNVILEGGAKPENIFWQVAGFVEVGAGATMQGIILAKTKADFITGSSLNGRVLTQKACNLQMATITEPDTEPIDDLVSYFEVKVRHSADDDDLKNHGDWFVNSYNQLQKTKFKDPFDRCMYNVTFLPHGGRPHGGRRLDHPQQESRQLWNYNYVSLYLRASGTCRGCGSSFFLKHQVRRLRKLDDLLPVPGAPSKDALFTEFSALLSSSSGHYQLVDLEEVSEP
jgi:hypothetical protein